MLSSTFRTDLQWELLYVDNLVRIVDIMKEVVVKFKRWSDGMQSKVLRMNVNKTKTMVSSIGRDVVVCVKKMFWETQSCVACVIGGCINNVTVCMASCMSSLILTGEIHKQVLKVVGYFVWTWKRLFIVSREIMQGSMRRLGVENLLICIIMDR